MQCLPEDAFPASKALPKSKPSSYFDKCVNGAEKLKVCPQMLPSREEA